MPLPLTVSCFSKIQIGFTFLVLAYLGSPGQRAVKRVCVYRPRKVRHHSTLTDLSVPTMYCCRSNSFSSRSSCSWVKIVRTRLPLPRPARDFDAPTHAKLDDPEQQQSQSRRRLSDCNCGRLANRDSGFCDAKGIDESPVGWRKVDYRGGKNLQILTNKLSPRGQRDDMPPPMAVRLAVDLPTSVRGRVRSPHISGGRPAAGSLQRADSQGWDRQTDGSRYRLMTPPLRRGS